MLRYATLKPYRKRIYEIETMINPPIRLLMAAQEHLSANPEILVQVQGRDMWVAAEKSANHEYTVITPDLAGRTVFDRRSAKLKRTVRSRPLPQWARYIAGAILVLSDDEIELPGITAIIIGDEPSGPRYEHALGMAFVAMWYDYHQLEYDVDTLLDVLERVQKQYVD